MSSAILCNQLHILVVDMQSLLLDAPKRLYVHPEVARLNMLREKETRLRTQIYKTTGFPAYQLCETNEPCVSEK
jgi:hypothetical protein